MKTFKNYSKIYLYLIVVFLIFIKILSWNNLYEKDCNAVSGYSKDEMHSFTLKICDVPKESDNSVTFTAKIISASKLSNKINVRVKYGERLGLSYGDEIKVRGTLSLSESAMNPGNFDYRQYLKSQGICALLDTDITRIQAVKGGFLKKFYSIRTTLTKQIFKYLPHNEASLVNALVTGGKDEMPDDIENFFKCSGVYHIVAVSGLHLNMLILFLSYIYTRLPVKKKKKQFIMLTVNSIGILFMLIFTGYGVSVKRAAIMSIILCIAPFANREYSSLHALFTAMCLILLTEPYAYLDVSFQLSFLATTGIIIAVNIIQKYKISEKKISFITESIIISAFSWIFTFPSSVNAFHGVSLITLISNMVILPMVPVLLAFSYIFAIVCLTCTKALCCFAACFAVVPAKAVIFLAELFSSIPGAYIPMSQEGMLTILAEIIAVTILVRNFIYKRRKTACLIMTLIIIANSSFLLYNNIVRKCEVHFINVGQGDCAIIRTPFGRNILIDCGSDSINNVYENNVLPYMNYEGIYKIDMAFVSHYHSDHSNGIIPMLEDGCIKTLVLPNRLIASDERKDADKIIQAAVSANVRITFLSKGDIIDIDPKSEIEILNPSKRTRSDANNASAVIKFNCYETDILFASDIEEASQYILLEDDISADILKVPHHGGFSALSDKFAGAVNCDYAVISCGVNNRYSHPDEKTLETYSDATILRTDTNKTIKFIINKNYVRHFVYCD